MKKVTSVFMAFVLLLALTACNSGGGSGGAKAEIKGETKEVGDFSVLVPEGWMGYDMELSGEPITYKTQIYKGAKEEIDMWSTPSVQITYWKDGEEDILTSAKSAYNDTKDIDPVTIGDYTWKGFTGSFSDKPVTFLYTDEVGPFSLAVFTEVDGKTISLEDADFQAIVNSLKVTQK